MGRFAAQLALVVNRHSNRHWDCIYQRSSRFAQAETSKIVKVDLDHKNTRNTETEKPIQYSPNVGNELTFDGTLGEGDVRRYRLRSGTKRVLRSPSHEEGHRRRAKFVSGSAIQVFVLRVDAFLGTELFGAEVPITIGRHRDCSIRLDGDTVSRVHCRIQLDGDQLFIEDMGSANGTLLNSDRIQGRTEALATDAIQVGEYTLKLRALLPRSTRQARPSSGISDKPTRKKARVSADGFVDTDESLIDIERKVDPRLYEAALRRATGTEPPKTPVPLVVMDGGRNIEEQSSELERTCRDEKLIAQVRESKEPPTNRGFEIDPNIDKRINELEKAVLALNEETPEKISRQKSKPNKENVFKAWVELGKDGPADELARANIELGLS